MNTDLIVTLVILGVVCGLVFKAKFIPEFFKYCIYAVCGVIALLKLVPFLSQYLG